MRGRVTAIRMAIVMGRTPLGAPLCRLRSLINSARARPSRSARYPDFWRRWSALLPLPGPMRINRHSQMIPPTPGEEPRSDPRGPRLDPLRRFGAGVPDEFAGPISFHSFERRRVRLDGVSQPYDARINAIRPDLADIALADLYFAPHYAQPAPRGVIAASVPVQGRAE